MSRGWASLAARLLRPVLRVAAAARHRRLHAGDARPQPHASIPHRPLTPASPSCCHCRLPDRLLQLPLTGARINTGGSRFRSGYVFWPVCGVRVALMMPVEPIANWIFKITEPVDKRRVLTTVVTVMAAVTCAADRGRVCRRGARSSAYERLGGEPCF